MKKNIITDNRMFQYAASAIAFLAFQEAGAAVVYTDLDPDVVLGGEGAMMTFDVNSDGIDDLSFQVGNVSGNLTYYGFNVTYMVNFVSGSALNGNELLGTIVSYSGYSGVSAPILATGEGINADDPFVIGTAGMALSVSILLSGLPYLTYQTGNWQNQSMKYMGFRINIDKDHYYGWVRLSVNADATQLTIHDYAYQNTPNEAIFAGQVATAIEENPLNNADIYAYGSQIHVVIPENIQNDLTVNVFDLNGKTVFTEQGINGSSTIEAANLAAGNYIVMITDGILTTQKQINLIR